MSLPRFLSAAAAITWLIAAVRVWQDAHTPYTTGLCALIAIGFAAYTLTQTRKENTKGTPHKSWPSYYPAPSLTANSDHTESPSTVNTPSLSTSANQNKETDNDNHHECGNHHRDRHQRT